jgi:nucleotide-binding universal stress UspA family protein
MIPPARVLAAVDFSDPSRVALACAARLAVHSGAELHVLHAQDSLLATAATERGIDLAGETHEELLAFTRSTWPVSECKTRHQVVVGSAVLVILDAAYRASIDVVVLGARGMSGAERLVFGSTTEGVLRRAELPVLVVPDGWTPPRPDTPDLSGTGPVIVGVDFNASSVEAAAAAARLAAKLETDSVLIHVVPELRVLERWRTHAGAALDQQLTQARGDLERLARGLESSCPMTLHVETGSVPDRLAKIAHASPQGILVLGRAIRARGYAPPGTIAYRVLSWADVPVLVHTTP